MMTTPAQREMTRRLLRREAERRAAIAKSAAALATGPIEIAKTDEEQRLLFGFAKFSEDPNNRGHYYVDRQGDVVEVDVLEKAAYEYVLTSRDSGEMHKTAGAATLVESFMITPTKLKKMGMAPDALPAGWWVGFRVNEPQDGQPDPWELVKNGTYEAFSIEGMGSRLPIDKADPSASAVHSDRPMGKQDDKCTCEHEEGSHGRWCPLYKRDTLYSHTVDGDDDTMSAQLEKEVARRSIREMARKNVITTQEADQMLRNLVDAPPPAGEEGEDEPTQSSPSPAGSGPAAVAAILMEMMGIQKHKGEDHPESSHGNRLFSDEAEEVGDLMKKLKTRFKRTDAETLKSLRAKFSKASGEKASLSHDQVVAELARRNILPVSKITFKSSRFKKLRKEVMAAITVELEDEV